MTRYQIMEAVTITPLNIHTGEGGVYEWRSHAHIKETFGSVLEAKQHFLKYHKVMPENAEWDRAHSNFVFKNFTKTLISGTPPLAKIGKVKSEH